MRHGKTAFVFGQAFFLKGLRRSNARALVALRRGRNSFSFKAPRKGEFQAANGLKEGKHTSGGFPFLRIGYLNSLSAFSFDTRGTKEKAWQKENAAGEVSPLASGDKGSAPLTAPPFREKVDENNSGFAVANSWINLKGADGVSPFGL